MRSVGAMHLFPLVLLLLPSVFAAGFDSQGKEFIIGFMENRQYAKNAPTDVDLFITTISNTPAQVLITTPKFDPGWSKSVNVSRGTVEKVTIPHTIRGEGVEKSNKGIWIQATEEVSVYGVNKEVYSTDAYIALPTDVIGREYYAISYQDDVTLMVVATQDDSVVSIQWPVYGARLQIAYDGKTYGKGDTMTVILNKFETFHALQLRGTADFTGTHITSTKPIAVISGNRKVVVPAKSNSADHLTEMLMPVNTWGKVFIATSTPDRSIGDLYRFVASEDDTSVELAGGQSFTLAKAGDYETIDIATGDYQKVTSDKPIEVAMFSKTFDEDGPNFGDPNMCIIIPVSQYASDYTWSTVQDPKGNDFNNKVSIVIEKDKVAGLRLDNAPVTWEEVKDVMGSTKVNLWAHIEAGPHNIYHSDPSVTFMALASGTTNFNSYAFQAGMRLATINGLCSPTVAVPGDVVDNDCDGKVDEEVNNGIDDDGDGQIDEDLAEPPRVDGQWGDWELYGSCSVSCGLSGTKTRYRHCNNPTPVGHGMDCQGQDTETLACNEGPCPVDGSWGEWSDPSPCSVTCGAGQQSRVRECDNPSPSSGGVDCAGDAEEETACDMPPCAVDGNWGEWATTGACSVTCGEGTQERSRTCDNPPPENGGQECDGPDTDTVNCSLPQCPAEANWGEWAVAGTCGVTCGIGMQPRARKCDNPPPVTGGQPCPGPAEDEFPCRRPPCPGLVNGNWSEWTQFGECSVTCGTGSQTRTRQCNNSAPQHGGSNCSGSATETTPCELSPCAKSESKVDMVVVLDSSAWTGAYYYGMMKYFLGDLVNYFPVGPNDVQVGLHSCPCQNGPPAFSLNHYTDKDLLQSHIMNLSYSGGDFNISEALESLFSPQQGDRLDARNVYVVFYGGPYLNSFYSPIQKLKSLHPDNTYIVVVLGQPALMPMALVPYPFYVYQAPTFFHLMKIRQSFLSQAFSWQTNATAPGEWGPWGRWSICTQTCGSGSRVRTRGCSIVHLFHANNCTGRYSQTESCNEQPCATA